MTQPSAPLPSPSADDPRGVDDQRQGVHAELRRADRAITFAWIALAAQVLLTIASFALWAFEASSRPLLGVALFNAVGIIGTAVIVLLSALRRAAVVEEIEIEQTLRGGGEGASIFATDADARPADKRLQAAYRWVLPASSVLLAAGLINAGLWLLSQVRTDVRLNYGPDNMPATAAMTAGFCFGIAFIGFVVGRYLIGMANTPAWRLLNAAGVYLLGGIYLLMLVGVALVAATFGAVWAMEVVDVVVPAIAVLIGVEILFNQVLDFYRPRDTAFIPRPSFDSRLLALVASPGSVVRSLNEAVNYQFGFEITQSWFWRLLSRAAVWLVLTSVTVLLLISCVVIVQPGEAALVTRFGRIIGEPRQPGLHLKAPWPIDSYERFNVSAVRIMDLVEHPSEAPEAVNLRMLPAVLWTNRHEHGSESLLVVAATGPEATASVDEPSIALMGLEAFVHWHIDDVMAFATSSEAPEAQLRAIAQRELSNLLMTLDIDQLLSSRRAEVGEQLMARVREQVQQQGLGIAVDWVGIAGVYPPADGQVASTFQQTLAARQQAATAIAQAEQRAVELLTQAAGSQAAALEIVSAINELGRLQRADAEEAQLNQQNLEVERLVLAAGGQAAVRLAEARGYRWNRENTERGRAARFGGRLAAYEAAPTVYANKLTLDNWLSASQGRRKVLLWVNDPARLLVRFDETTAGGNFSQISLPDPVTP